MILAMGPFYLLFSLPFILTTHALENGDRTVPLSSSALSGYHGARAMIHDTSSKSIR